MRYILLPIISVIDFISGRRRDEAHVAEKVDVYCSTDLDSMKKTEVTENQSVPEDSVKPASQKRDGWNGGRRRKKKRNPCVY